MSTLTKQSIFVSVLNSDQQVFCVLKFLNQEDVRTEFVDSLHDQGFVLKPITEEEYKAFDEGDEMPLEELSNATGCWMTSTSAKVSKTMIKET